MGVLFLLGPESTCMYRFVHSNMLSDCYREGFHKQNSLLIFLLFGIFGVLTCVISSSKTKIIDVEIILDSVNSLQK